jgi:hypothetical protein
VIEQTAGWLIGQWGAIGLVVILQAVAVVKLWRALEERGRQIGQVVENFARHTTESTGALVEMRAEMRDSNRRLEAIEGLLQIAPAPPHVNGRVRAR